MGYIDLHDAPFKESTITKLEIFEAYAEAWIPTFVMTPTYPEIHIFDFFAGTGYDNNGTPGSPIRILQKAVLFKGILFTRNTTIVVHLNEFQPSQTKQEKFELLKKAVNAFMEDAGSLHLKVKVKLYNKDFEALFEELLPTIRKFPSLVYLDQNGVKFLKYLLKLDHIKKTDFLFFVSSSYFKRFGNREEFKKHIDIDVDELSQSPYQHVHRALTDQVIKLLPNNSPVSLYPFTLKRESNYYGIIFGATHPLAVDKFLHIAWNKDKVSGDANFDIDGEQPDSAQTNLFAALKVTKVDQFKSQVEALLLSGQITDNFELYQFTLSSGHIHEHVVQVIKKLCDEKKLYYEGRTPGINYDNVHKKKRRVVYKVLKK